MQTIPHLHLRPESVRDYPAIALLHSLAFENRASEPAVVALRRQAASYDPELALVAESGGRILGHALFTPESIRLLDQSVRAVNLAPIAVHPDWQRRGIGRTLIEEGHRIAREKGYALSFLLGHPAYYARLGYLGGVYGASRCLLNPEGLPPCELGARPPAPAHLEALRALWLHEEGAVDFAIDPGPDILGWVSPNPAVEALVWIRSGQVAGYTRTSRLEPGKVRMFLAADPGAARQVASGLAARYGAQELPLHPRSASAACFEGMELEAWDAGMAYALDAPVFTDFCNQIRAGLRPCGRPLWPVVFDVA